MDFLTKEFEAIQSIQEELQNKEYFGYILTSNEINYRIRVAKKTPKK